ncbi:MAG: type II toxin-antitoxin system RelB/DinJ family antitoxin [Deltaproteobacteria bacterium]|jgi:hypothetical protein|nr:type II toxin-antitoxin system RelB/DinJ family antitoxin [Deltaproteobacteria bacterium]
MITIQVDSKVEAQAEEVLHALGLSIPDALRLTLERIAEDRQFALLQKPVSEAEVSAEHPHGQDLEKLPAFGMWADREDMADPILWIRERRSSRRHRLYGDISAD